MAISSLRDASVFMTTIVIAPMAVLTGGRLCTPSLSTSWKIKYSRSIRCRALDIAARRRPWQLRAGVALRIPSAAPQFTRRSPFASFAGSFLASIILTVEGDGQSGGGQCLWLVRSVIVAIVARVS